MTYFEWLEEECDYQHVRGLPDGRWAAISRLMYTAAIITGKVGDTIGYDNRWCYHSFIAAEIALRAWDGLGEPPGWHRHPASGRRRTDGDELLEYLMP